jgi:predicted esterase
MKRSVFWCLLGIALFSIHCTNPTPSNEPRNEASGEKGSSKETITAEPQPEPRPEPKAEPRQEMAPEPRSEPRIEPRSEPKAEPRSEPVADLDASVPEPQAEPRPELGPELQPDVNKQWLSSVKCGMKPPTGATLAQIPTKYTGGTCPTLQAGTNKLTSGKRKRQFILVLPKNPKAGEQFPVLFLWHWLKGTASKFLKQGEIQKAADQQRFIAILPESPFDLDLFGLVKLPWPILTTTPKARFEEEFTFFDDMLACIAKQYKIDRQCVSSIGVSAGALFTVALSQARSQTLANFVSLSGGSGNSKSGLSNRLIPEFKSPKRKLPGLVLWGGPSDSCVLLNFQQASQDLGKALDKNGHFFIECIHNCKHAEPPVTPPAGQSKYAPIWEFVFRHPFWLKSGQSPYQVNGWKSPSLNWCGIGKGSASIRTGTCPGQASCPI